MNNMYQYPISRCGVRMTVQNIMEYPFHWHRGSEIIYVLNGDITLDLHKDPEHLVTLCLKSDEIYAVGNHEIHRMYNCSTDNEVLILHIDQEKIAEVYEFSDTLEFDYLTHWNNDIEKEQIQQIKATTKYLAKNVGNPLLISDIKFKNLLHEYLILLIDNFEIIARKLKREDCSPRYYERLSRIAMEIISNSDKKNLLHEIAESEHLNAEYISQELKKRIDYSFQQLINFYRVEKSIKLLLTTNMNMIDLFMECGFSASRYFYKEFKKFYAKGPASFRTDFLNEIISAAFIDPATVKEITGATNCFGYNSIQDEWCVPIVKIDADAASHKINEEWKRETFFIDYNYIGEVYQTDYIDMIVEHIKFEKIRIINFLNSNCSLDTILNIITYLNSRNLTPVFVINSGDIRQDAQKLKFVEALRECAGGDERYYYEIEQIEEDVDSELSSNNLLKMIVEQVQDRDVKYRLSDIGYTATEYIESFNSNRLLPKLLLKEKRSLGKPIFNDGKGLVASNGLIKPVFYSCKFLSMLGDEVISSGRNHIATRNKNGLQILLYNHMSINKSNTNAEELYLDNIENEECCISISLKVQNLIGKYKVVSYYFDSAKDNGYEMWLGLKKPAFIETKDIELINRMTFPEVTFEISMGHSYENEYKLREYSITFISFEKEKKMDLA